MKAKEYREQLAETFIHVLEERQLDWKKEWQGNGLLPPKNEKTGHTYKGINRFYLTFIAMQRGYEDHRWATFKQIQDRGWKLQDAKGQGVKVEYWYPYDRKEQKNLTWEEFRRTGGQLGERYFLKSSYSTVFNGTLIQGIPKLPLPETREISPDAIVEKLSVNMGVEILSDGGGKAFYRPSEDKIHLPIPQSFESAYAYASTALHELAHATGAKHRLNRDLSGGFGTPAYAYEELVAEISSCFMSINLQTEQGENHIENHKAYVQSWISVIREKPESLVKAVQQAERTASYMEYKAELINEQQYFKESQSSVEASETTIIEVNESPARDVAPLLEKNSSEDMIAMNQEQIGHLLLEMRVEKGYSKGEISEVLLISKEELTSIEAGATYPDPAALQMIGNIYGVKIDELQKGNIVPLKSRSELSEMISEIRAYANEMRKDTQFFKDFMIKHGIEDPAANNKQPTKDDYYVIEDQETGNTITDENGKEIRAQSKEEADKIAALLNREIESGEDAQEIIQAYEYTIGRQESYVTKLDEKALFDYAASCKEYLRFGHDVERCMRGELTQMDAILVCQTPNLYIQVGCSSLPMHITQKHVKNCMHKKVPGKPRYHGITMQNMKRLPEELEDPSILAESITNEKSLISILGYTEDEGNPILVSIFPEGKATYELELVDSNFITSVYGKDNASDFVNRLIEQKKVLLINENKSSELALLPLQLRQDHLVPTFNSIVKPGDTIVNRQEMSKGNTNKHIEKKENTYNPKI